jgi:hypothetical protein
VASWCRPSRIGWVEEEAVALAQFLGQAGEARQRHEYREECNQDAPRLAADEAQAVADFGAGGGDGLLRYRCSGPSRT